MEAFPKGEGESDSDITPFNVHLVLLIMSKPRRKGWGSVTVNLRLWNYETAVSYTVCTTFGGRTRFGSGWRMMNL